MADAGVVKYLKEGIARGHSIESLKSELIKSGWSSSEVNAAVRQVEGRKVPPVPKSLKPANPAKVKSSGVKERPLGIAILAILAWISAVATPIVVLFVTGVFTALGPPLPISAYLVALSIGIVIALLPFFIGRGLWKGINAWRIVYIVLLSIQGLTAITALITSPLQGIFNLAIIGLIIGYLGFNKKVRAFFGK